MILYGSLLIGKTTYIELFACSLEGREIKNVSFITSHNLL